MTTTAVKPKHLYYDTAGRACVSLAEAARLKRVSREIIRRLVAERRLPAVKLGARVVVVPVDALASYTPNRVRVRAARKAAQKALDHADS